MLVNFSSDENDKTELLSNYTCYTVFLFASVEQLVSLSDCNVDINDSNNYYITT